MPHGPMLSSEWSTPVREMPLPHCWVMKDVSEKRSAIGGYDELRHEQGLLRAHRIAAAGDLGAGLAASLWSRTNAQIAVSLSGHVPR